jgi:hypothetical protein
LQLQSSESLRRAEALVERELANRHRAEEKVGMYRGGGVGGLIGGGTLAVTGFSTFAVVAVALGLLLLGLAMVRYSALRRPVRGHR